MTTKIPNSMLADPGAGGGATEFADLADAATVNLPAQNDPLAQALAGKVPATRAVNGKSLSSDVVLVPSDIGAVASAAVGVSVAPLVSGLVPAGNLPSYVDDVLEYANYAALPAMGETGKIYVTTSAETVSGTAYPANTQRRWSGSAYVVLVASPGTTDNVVEGTGNLYATPARTRATPLTGLTSGTRAAPTAADTLLQALAKLKAFIEGLPTVGGQSLLTATGDIPVSAGTVTRIPLAGLMPLDKADPNYTSMNEVSGAPRVLGANITFSPASSPAPVDTGYCKAVVTPGSYTIGFTGWAFKSGNAFDESGNLIAATTYSVNGFYEGQAAQMVVGIVVPASSTPQPVFVDSTPSTAPMIVGERRGYQYNATNATGYSSTGEPSGMSVSSSGLRTGKTTAAGTYAASVVATGPGGTATATWNVAVKLGRFDTGKSSASITDTSSGVARADGLLDGQIPSDGGSAWIGYESNQWNTVGGVIRSGFGGAVLSCGAFLGVIEVIVGPMVGGGDWGGVNVFYVPGGTKGLMVGWGPNIGGWGVVNIDGPSQVGPTVPFSSIPEPVDGDVVTVELTAIDSSNTNIVLKKNGTQVYSLTTGYQGTYHGFYSYGVRSSFRSFRFLRP